MNDYITPILKGLYCSPIMQRFEFKNALNITAPPYTYGELSNVVKTDHGTCGERRLPLAAVALWNRLLYNVCDSQTIEIV